MRIAVAGTLAQTVNVHHFAITSRSDRPRDPSMQSVLKCIKLRGVSGRVCEPTFGDCGFFSGTVRDLEGYKSSSQSVIANSWLGKPVDVTSRVNADDLFRRG